VGLTPAEVQRFLIGPKSTKQHSTSGVQTDCCVRSLGFTVALLINNIAMCKATY